MKKALIILIGLSLFVYIPLIAQKDVNCTIVIPVGEFIVDGTDISPGDVVCILAGDKDYILFKDIQGTEEQPITIINKNGPVVINTEHFYGVKFDNCKHIIFSGTGSEDIDYGFQIKRVANGTGISIDNKSTNFEVENIEVSYTLIAAIYAKTEPYQGDCNNLVTRDNFTMYNLKFHDCYIHNVADEGFYIGSSKYTGLTIYDCNDTVVLPHVIIGVEIYNNILERTGWDGIQVSSSPEDCSIHDNIIREDSWEEYPGQMSGILIGGGSVCDCYNNQIYDGKGDGIDVLGLGNMMIYNNLIVRPGRMFFPGQPDKFKHGIWIGEVVTSNNAYFKVYNNTIISPKSSGIKYTNANASKGYFINNLITDPGQLQHDPQNAYLNIDNSIAPNKVEISHNYLSENNTSPKFMNLYDEIFDLLPDSPAINYGTFLTNEGVTFDIFNRARPFHTYFDAGAFECHDPSADINENKEVIGMPYPMPASNKIYIPFRKFNGNIITVSIISLQGRVLLKQKYRNYDISDKNLVVIIENIKSGNYILNITTDNYSDNKPIIILK